MKIFSGVRQAAWVRPVTDTMEVANWGKLLRSGLQNASKVAEKSNHQQNSELRREPFKRRIRSWGS